MITQLPLVSVIIPVFNRARYLEEAIESVLSQTLDSLELIIVDDGSTDDSSEVADLYLGKDTRVKYFYQENKGVSAARNKGLSEANGTYVYFLDSDDRIDQSFLSTSYDAIKMDDSDVVVIGAYYESRLPNPTALPTCAQMWKRSFLIEHSDVQFPEGVQPGEDGLFSHCLLALTNRIAANPYGEYFYRSHDEQSHRLATKEGDRIIELVERWLVILAAFYDRRDLWNTKSLHLARFLEHEPFEFRYLKTTLNSAQKQRLISIIQDFYKQRILPHLSSREIQSLSEPFRYFLYISSHSEFDNFYQDWHAKRQKYLKRVLFLSKFIPFKAYRRKLRDQVRRELGK